MAPVSRIDTIFVPATDTRLAADWYMRLFEMKEIFESAGYIGLRFDGDGRGETAITLYPACKIDRDAHYAFNFATGDADALHALLTSEGLEVTPIQSVGAIRYFDFRDVLGNWVNVCEA